MNLHVRKHETHEDAIALAGNLELTIIVQSLPIGGMCKLTFLLANGSSHDMTRNMFLHPCRMYGRTTVHHDENIILGHRCKS